MITLNKYMVATQVSRVVVKFAVICAVSLVMAFSSVGAYALNLPAPMSPPRLVNDFAGMFSAEQNAALEQKLVAFDRKTSTQIAVVTVPDLDGTAVSDYASQLFDKWGIGGNSDKNNGILILVKPKTADSRGEVFIATGYGLEGVVPDALAGRIVDYDILPSFREGRYFEGVDKAAATLMSLTQGEFTADQYIKKNEGGVGAGVFLLFAIVALLIFAGASKGGTSSGQTISSDGSDIARAILLGSLLSGGSRGHGGGFGGFSGGGGGFGGFGGGFSGGGGAGGSW